MHGCDFMKKKKLAAALKYDINKDNAPKVIAKGKGLVAENIIKTAKENNITIYEDDQLAKKLQTLQIQEEIPVELYEAVANILAFISKIDTKKGERIE
ncbi:flagellar biosynthesis protein [Alkalithermobacter thermoalcaliphilus JW-YL-7 = DSM 7308]|uniref:Flagellar biosynthesis protein n=2 Tax=Clostridium paradoxum TaxID=29346 RepID=A0A150FR27_CLOPD|nr:type III secretion exporter [[Clostridium] paradoxum JW-YL-7 = DSM 7308]SHL12141.1 flagellar biosynthesis protein [[Clostridium] paradoxum JW-YL-7 = DSM 7308]